METTQIGADSERLLYSEFKKKINAEAARAQIKKLEYDLAEVTAGNAMLKNACAEANNLGLGGVCVLPAQVKACSAVLPDESECALIACISYPHGGDATSIKVKAVKRAIRDGADEVEVTAPISQIRDGNFGYVKREFKKLRSACKKRSLRIDVGCSVLSRQEVERVSVIAADCGVNSIRAAGIGSVKSCSEAVTAVKNAVKDRCTVKAEGVATVLEMSSAIDIGATVIGSKNAAAVARAILSASQNEI